MKTRRFGRPRSVATLLTLFAGGCSTGEAPPPPGLPEGIFANLELEASYTEPFSFLNSVRELSDGTVMAADPLSQVLLRMDLLAGTADTLGRVGEGPGEYQQPDQVLALPGDSTLLVDIGKMELTVVGPDGVIHDGIRMATPTEEGRLTVLLPRFLDRQGRIYYAGGGGMGEGPPDSTLVTRFDRATGVSETMGWIWRPEPRVTRSGDNVRMMATLMAGRDDWAVGPNGAFAVVRNEGYVVEWHHPDGRIVSGPTNPVESPSISDEEKRAFLDRRASESLMTMVMASPGGAMEMSMRRGGGGLGDMEPNLMDFEWAERFPAFRPDRSRVSPSGELWVERWLPSDRDPEVDVFDGDGLKLGTVGLPEGRDVVGFGTTGGGDPAVYLVRTDEFDLKWLERYRIVR